MPNSQKPLVLVGGGIFAERMRYHFEADGRRHVVAFSVERDFLDAAEKDGLPCLPFEDLEDRYPPEEADLFVAIGYSERNRLRERLVNAAGTRGYDLASYVSTAARLEDTVVPANAAVFANATVCFATTIGRGVLVGAGVNLAHHGTVGDFSYLATGATVAGKVTVGARVFCGVGSVVIDSIEIAAETLIGAGSVVTKSITKPGVYAGNPARLLRPAAALDRDR